MGLFSNFHSMLNLYKMRLIRSRNVEKLKQTVEFHYDDRKTHNYNNNKTINKHTSTTVAHTTIDFVCFSLFLFWFDFHSLHYLFGLSTHNITAQQNGQTICIEHSETFTMFQNGKEEEEEVNNNEKKHRMKTKNMKTEKSEIFIPTLHKFYTLYRVHNSLNSYFLHPLLSLSLCMCVSVMCCMSFPVLHFNCSQATNKSRGKRKKNANELN